MGFQSDIGSLGMEKSAKTQLLKIKRNSNNVKAKAKAKANT